MTGPRCRGSGTLYSRCGVSDWEPEDCPGCPDCHWATDQHGDCVTCGFPRYRPEGHAAWCERVAEANRNLNRAHDELRALQDRY